MEDSPVQAVPTSGAKEIAPPEKRAAAPLSNEDQKALVTFAGVATPPDEPAAVKAKLLDLVAKQASDFIAQARPVLREAAAATRAVLLEATAFWANPSFPKSRRLVRGASR